MRRVFGVVAGGLLLVGVTFGVASAVPNEAAIKFCDEAFKNGWVLTREQVAQCRSASDNKHEVPDVVTNPGGNVPPGQQP